LIRSAGAKLFFLPRYSPDLNPIERIFAKLKTLLRETDPRTCGRSGLGASTLGDPRQQPLPAHWRIGFFFKTDWQVRPCTTGGRGPRMPRGPRGESALST